MRLNKGMFLRFQNLQIGVGIAILLTLGGMRGQRAFAAAPPDAAPNQTAQKGADTQASAPASAAGNAQEGRGSVLLVGGGTTTPAVIRAFLAAAGGADKRIVILAQTELNPVEGGPLSVALFREQGAAQVEAPVGLPAAQLIARLADARGVWIPGGDQNRFMTAFPEAGGVPAAIRAVWARGGVVGGTSAGASLLGGLMPTGEKTEAIGISTGACPVAPALRVLPDAIVDQHFLFRNRLMRLLTAVLEHPKRVGVGVDQGAWGLVRGGSITAGGGQIVLIHAAHPAHAQGAALGAEGVTLRILLPGEQAPLSD